MAWIIQYQNLSSKTVRITSFGGETEAVVGETNHEPASSLGSGASDYLSLDQNSFKVVAEGGIDIYQGVVVDDKTLWVRLKVPVQVFGLGKAPYWYYQINDGADPGLKSKAWSRHDTKPVSTTINDLSVDMSPVEDHKNLTVSVKLDDHS